MPESWSQPSHRSEDDLLTCRETIFYANTTEGTPTTMMRGSNTEETAASLRGPQASPSQWFNSAPGIEGDEYDRTSPLSVSPNSLQNFNQPFGGGAALNRSWSVSPNLRQKSLADMWKSRTASPPGSSSRGGAVLQMTQNLRQISLLEAWRPTPKQPGQGDVAKQLVSRQEEAEQSGQGDVEEAGRRVVGQGVNLSERLQVEAEDSDQERGFTPVGVQNQGRSDGVVAGGQERCWSIVGEEHGWGGQGGDGGGIRTIGGQSQRDSPRGHVESSEQARGKKRKAAGRHDAEEEQESLGEGICDSSQMPEAKRLANEFDHEQKHEKEMMDGGAKCSSDAEMRGKDTGDSSDADKRGHETR